MRRNRLVHVVLVMLVLLGSLPFTPQSEAIENFTLGLKYWYPSWKLEYEDGTSSEFDPTYGMIGPTLSFSLSERFAMSLSVYHGAFENDYFDATRTDSDILLAYIINPYVNVFAGIKAIVYSTDSVGNAGSEDLTSGGLGVGVGGNLPFGDSGFALYGTLAYSFLSGKYKFDSSYGSLDADFTYPMLSAEVGVRYALEHWIFMGSYRYQKSTIDFDLKAQGGTENVKIDDFFSGPVLFVGYRF